MLSVRLLFAADLSMLPRKEKIHCAAPRKKSLGEFTITIQSNIRLGSKSNKTQNPFISFFDHLFVPI